MNNQTSKADSNQIREEIERVRRFTVTQLKEKYREVFAEDTRSNHKQFLFRRIAWRIQANAWGGLSDRAKQRALEIANDSDLRVRAPKNFLADLDESRSADARVRPSCDPRLPKAGTQLIRRYQGRDVVVLVRIDGTFESSGRVYRSLSKAVSEATGPRWNGFSFCGLGEIEVSRGA